MSPSTTTCSKTSSPTSSPTDCIVESGGALCVFPPGFTNRDGEALPLIVRKSDEGFGYAASDLAAVRDRVDNLHADEMLYVVGVPQAQHFEMVFAVARMAGWLPDRVRCEHVTFGNVLGPDRKMFKSRSGETVKLASLLGEAVERADEALKERNTDLDDMARTAAGGADRARGDQVRRPLDRPTSRLHLRPRSHDRLRGRHRPVPAVRARATSLHLSSSRCAVGPAGSRLRARHAPRASPGAGPARVPRGVRIVTGVACNRTDSASTSSTWPSASPRSTTPARSSPLRVRCAISDWRCATSPSGPWRRGLSVLGIDAPETDVVRSTRHSRLALR